MIRAILVILVLLTGLPASANADGNDAVAAVIARLFESKSVETGSKSVDKAIGEVRDYYATRAFKPVWVRDDGPKSKAKSLLAELKTSIVHGLSPQFYHVDEISSLMDSQDPEKLAQLDMLLSGAVVEFGRHLRNGRIGPDSPGAENAVKPVELDVAEYIEGAADAGNFREYASKFINADDRYVRLVAKLSEMQRMQSAKMWPAISTSEGPIVKDAKDERIVAIRRLLAINGDLPPNQMDGPPVFDEAVATAVGNFQERHGLQITSELDMPTLEEMAVPVDQRIRQIQINLERRRWLNRPLEPSRVYINLSEPLARVVSQGKDIAFLGILNVDELRDVPTFFGTIDASRMADGKTLLDVLPDPKVTRGMAKTPIRIMLDGPVELKAGMQVFVTYITAWVSSDGRLHFGRDIFDRDPVLAKLMSLN